MNFSYNWLQSFFSEKLPEPKRLAEIITLKLFEVEELEKYKNDWLLNIDVLPNRAGDCFSHLGIANEISAITNLKIKKQDNRFLLKENKKDNKISLEIKNKNLCSRYSAIVVENLEIKPSPKWMQQRLETCGLQPINNIVDIINYVMLEVGQPMHAFDFDKITNNKIIVRLAKEKEEITTLDNKKLVLNKNILTISDSEKILGIAGIKGGKNAEINSKTKCIVLESANFNRFKIRQTSSFLKLRTDASLRFEHGLHPELTKDGLEMAIKLIKELTNGKINNLIDYYPTKLKKPTIEIDLNYTESLLGVNIPKNQIKKILTSLNFTILKDNNQKMKVEVPPRRIDLSIQEDIIEELGRIYGYEKIKPSLPKVPIMSPTKNKELYWANKIKQILKNINFNEVYNRSFVSQKQIDTFKYNPSKIIEVEKPVSLDQKYLRPNLLLNIVKNIKDNENFFDDIKIFELGKVFEKNNQITIEKNELIGLINKDSFYYIKGVVEVLLEKMNLQNINFTEFNKNCSFLHLKKRAVINSGSKEIGYIGNLSYKIKNDLKIKSNISFFSLNFDIIREVASDEIYYQEISKFPAITRDLSILVPIKTKFQQVITVINKNKNNLIKKIELFDVYQGKEIPENKKNLALRLTYKDDKKTLTDKEVNNLHEKIINKIEENEKWQIRK